MRPCNGSLTADLEAAREICEVAEASIEGKEVGGVTIVRGCCRPGRIAEPLDEPWTRGTIPLRCVRLVT
ncbi:MAG: hypothetical protein JSW71_03430, partial [Gemmatimonadota bacterium]